MEPTIRAADTPRLVGDDSLRIETVASLYHFERGADAKLAERAFFHVGGQLTGHGNVTNVTYRCQHFIVGAEVLANGLGFSW